MEEGFCMVAGVAENSLSFDVATAVALCFAKFGLINLNSRTWSSYLPRMMIYDSVGTNPSSVVIPIYHHFC